MKRLLSITIAISTAISLSGVGPLRATDSDVEGSYIVILKSSQDADRNEKAVKDVGGRVDTRFTKAINGFVARIKRSEIARLLADPNILAIEEDLQVTINDTQSSPPWGLDRLDQRALPLNSSFTASSYGQSVDVYVVDTGVNAGHTEFSGRMGSGYTAILDSVNTGDCNGHGTHVAGTTAGTIYGVAKQARVIPVRVLDCSGSGSISGVVAGLEWIITNHSAGVPAVANMSLGGGASTAIDTAVQSTINDGVTVVVAAGNSNVNACNSSPARVAAAITVAATTSSDARASYSNYGSCVDIFAPGSSITSAWHTSSTATNTISGTSMASPHVAGAVATLLSRFPTSTPSQVATLLRDSATSNVVTSAGTGSPNFLLFQDPTGGTTPPVVTTAPGVPTIGSATVLARRSASISWTAPSSDGGSSITNYTVNSYKNGSASASSTLKTSGAVLTATFTGLTPGSSYEFRVQATNAVGTGQLSSPSNQITALK